MKSGNVPVVTIDGPSGSGKGTVGRVLAERLRWHYLDSGALYRLVGLAGLSRGVDLADGDRMAAIAATLNVRFETTAGSEKVYLDGIEVGRELRTERAGDAASKVAIVPAVRAALLERQRAFAVRPGLITDGRDMGTVVFPEAVLKIVLTATPEARAERRHKQLKEKGIDVSLPDLSREIALRDARDANRSVAPFRPAAEARIIDSTRLTPEEVVAQIVQWLERLGVATVRA